MNHRHSDTYGEYLRNISRHRLLTNEEEITLGRQVRPYVRLRNVKAELTESLGREPTLDEWAEAGDVEASAIAETMRVGERAYQLMIRANLRLVCAVAKKHLRRNVDVLDLVQEGNLGLARAVEKFDPGKGYRFSTYAYWWIRQAMTRTIYNDSRSIRLPIYISETMTMARIWSAKYAVAHGRNPSREELAIYLMGKRKLRAGPNGSLADSLALLDWYAELSRPVGSLNHVCRSDEDGAEMLDFMIGGGTQPDQYVEDEEISSFVQAALSRLPPAQQRVMTLRYGLNDGNNLTLEAIGHQMGLSRERIRQILNLAMRNLRRDTQDDRKQGADTMLEMN